MTPQQNRLYRFLLERGDNEVGPSFEEMASHLGLTSKSGVHRIVDRLVAMGKATKDPKRARSIRAVPVNQFHGVSSAVLIQELKRRGEWPHGR